VPSLIGQKFVPFAADHDYYYYFIIILLLLLLLLVVEERSKVVPHEYPNILSNATSTRVFDNHDDDDDDDDDDDENTVDDVIIGGSGGSLRFPNIISPVVFVVSFAIDAAIGPFSVLDAISTILIQYPGLSVFLSYLQSFMFIQVCNTLLYFVLPFLNLSTHHDLFNFSLEISHLTRHITTVKIEQNVCLDFHPR
jgi:hypothetical protein